MSIFQLSWVFPPGPFRSPTCLAKKQRWKISKRNFQKLHEVRFFLLAMVKVDLPFLCVQKYPGSPITTIFSIDWITNHHFLYGKGLSSSKRKHHPKMVSATSRVCLAASIFFREGQWPVHSSSPANRKAEKLDLKYFDMIWIDDLAIATWIYHPGN